MTESDDRAASEGGWEYAEVPLRLLRVDPRYQRKVNAAFVRKAVKRFEADAVGVITLSLRDDGYYYIIDGQQRSEIMRGVEGVDGSISGRYKRGMTLQQEAELFRLLDTKWTMSVDDKFRAYLAAGEPDIVMLDAIAKRHGWEPGPGRPTGSRYGCIRGCGWAFHAMQTSPLSAGENADHVLGLAARAWPDRPMLPSSLLDGLLMFHARYRGKYDPKRLVTVLSGMSPEDWRLRSRQAPGSGSIGQIINCVAKAYNYRLLGRRQLEIRL